MEYLIAPAGYVDDVFACCSVLSYYISKYGVDFVSPFWEMETDAVDEFVNSTLEETRVEIGEKVGEVVEYAEMGEIIRRR